MKFRVEEANERPIAVFQDEPSPGSWLLAFFLEEARTGVQEFLDDLERVRSGKSTHAGYRGNTVDVEFYSDRAVIEELWPEEGEDAEPKRIEITLDQARQLLLEWQIVLEQWR